MHWKYRPNMPKNIFLWLYKFSLEMKQNTSKDNVKR